MAVRFAGGRTGHGDVLPHGDRFLQQNDGQVVFVHLGQREVAVIGADGHVLHFHGGVNSDFKGFGFADFDHGGIFRDRVVAASNAAK